MRSVPVSASTCRCVDSFFEAQRNARGDLFLAFVEQELHPEIARRYPVRLHDVGLFGYSYGGLFTPHALTSGSRPFTRFGASSPGILGPESCIYTQYEALADSPVEQLHLTLNGDEMLGPSPFYRGLAMEFLRFVDLLRERPLPGLRVTTELFPTESHAGGLVDAYRSFLRTCYPGESR